MLPTKPQLSLAAQFDDLTRMVEVLLNENDADNRIKKLFEHCEKQRQLWVLDRRELDELKSGSTNLSSKNRSLETTLKNVREAYKKEVNIREKIQRDRDLLYAKLHQVQNYLQEDDSIISNQTKEDRASLKETILSSLNLHKLTTVIERSNEEVSNSLSDIEFDKTDEDLVDDNSSKVNPTKTTAADRNLITKSNIQQTDQNKQQQQNAVFANEDQFDDFSMLNDTLITAEEAQEMMTRTPLQKKPSTVSARSQASVNSKRSALSETLFKQRQSNLPNELKVDNRSHQFVTKKVYTQEKCSVCAGKIGFLTSCYHCRECRAISHVACKDQVPLPCIPFVSRANIGKQGRLVLISDFVQSNCRPCVPALIVHCTSEIEKRGLHCTGIYRVSGSESEVRTMKEKILKSKHGIPQLAGTDVHVLCNVIKKFLLELDEALISRISWREFVEAANVQCEQERRTRFSEAILLNLPTANRDTLAFLMLHLRRVAANPENKMNNANLAKMFGVTVLGYSIRDPLAMQIYEENKKQHQVVEQLLSLDDEFWHSILELDANQLNNTFINAGDISICINPSPEQIKAGRPSIGSRLCGGSVGTGTITPLKNKRKPITKKLKPLF